MAAKSGGAAFIQPGRGSVDVNGAVKGSGDDFAKAFL
jgi:hypothetical protein